MRIPTAIPLGSSTTGENSGAALADSKSSIVVNTDDDTGESNVKISTNEKVALSIDNNQNVRMGETSLTAVSRLVVSEPTGRCMELIHEGNSGTLSLSLNDSGEAAIASDLSMFLRSSCVRVAPGTFYIGQSPVMSSAEQLNYVVASPGTGAGGRALVLDRDLSIANINSVSAASYWGTVSTPHQPDIQSLQDVDVLGTLKLAGERLFATATDLNRLHRVGAGAAKANSALVLDADKSARGLGMIGAAALEGTLATASQPAITALGHLSQLTVAGGVGVGTTDPQDAVHVAGGAPAVRMVNNGHVYRTGLDQTGNVFFSVPRNVDLSENTNVYFRGTSALLGLSAVRSLSLEGTLLSPAQPNVTQVGTLGLLAVSGRSALGTALDPATQTARLVLADDEAGHCLRLTRGELAACDATLSAEGDLLLAPTRSVVLSSGTALVLAGGSVAGVTKLTAAQIVGELATGAQPNITALGTLRTLKVTDSITVGAIDAAVILGTLDTAEQPAITRVGTLSSLTVSGAFAAGSTITGSSVAAVSLSGTLETAAQPKITSLGTLTALTVAGLVAAPSVSATDLEGTLLTATQPNITSVGPLGSLKVVGEATADSVTALTLAGTLQTGEQTNITRVGTLGDLNVTRGLTAASVVAQSLSGALQTAAQPAITSVGRLESLSVAGAVDAASVAAVTLAGTLATAVQPFITRVGTLSFLATSAPLGVGVDDPGCAIDVNTAGMNGTAADAEPALRLADGRGAVAKIGLRADGVLDVATTGRAIAIAAGVGMEFSNAAISGLTQLSAGSLVGTLATAEQPNVTALGALTHLRAARAALGGGDTVAPSRYRLEVADTAGALLRLTNEAVAMTVSVEPAAEKPEEEVFTIGSSSGRVALASGVDLLMQGGGTISGLERLSVSAVVSASELVVGGVTVTADVFARLTSQPTEWSSAMIDENGYLVGVQHLSAATLAGTILTPAQPHIAQVGTLQSLDVAGAVQATGDVSAAGAVRASSLHVADASANTAEMGLSPEGAARITASAGALELQPGGTVHATQILLGTPSFSATMPLEVGHVPFVMTDAYAYNTSAGGHGTIRAGSTTAYNYSIRASGRVLCTQSVDVMSDRRVKTNVAPLTADYCESFVQRTTPVSFDWVDGDCQKSFGYIAQDLIRAGFSELVNLARDDHALEEVDDDGFVSPAGAKFTVSYQHIIPILAKNQARLMRENEELKTRMKVLEDSFVRVLTGMQ